MDAFLDGEAEATEQLQTGGEDTSSAAPAPAMGQGPASIAPAAESGALAAFNTRFRALGEEKDAKEREGKAARKAAGKAALKKMLGERGERVATRKTHNRDSEKSAESEMLNALSGESWGRVSSLVTVEAPAPGSAEHAGDKKKAAGAAAGGEAAAGGTHRMKDILISLKTKPLAAA